MAKKAKKILRCFFIALFCVAMEFAYTKGAILLPGSIRAWGKWLLFPITAIALYVIGVGIKWLLED